MGRGSFGTMGGLGDWGIGIRVIGEDWGRRLGTTGGRLGGQWKGEGEGEGRGNEFEGKPTWWTTSMNYDAQ